ncbi:MAG: hypothetical protein IJ930_11525 [Lachnospiraceae bacterium]|nr:hypothetical protein [Lachnospiraceae bacterium]
MNSVLKTRLEKLLAGQKRNRNGVIVRIIAVVGAVLVIAAVVYGICRLLRSELYLEDDDFDEDFVDEELEMD